MALVSRSCTYATWFPGLTSPQQSTNDHCDAGGVGCEAGVAATIELKLAELLQAYRNTAKEFWHPRVSESFTLVSVWGAPCGVLVPAGMSLASRMLWLCTAAGTASLAAILRNASNTEAEMDGMRDRNEIIASALALLAAGGMAVSQGSGFTPEWTMAGAPKRVQCAHAACRAWRARWSGRTA